MTVTVFFAAGADKWRDYHLPLAQALRDAGIDADLSDAAPDPMAVDYIIYAPGGTIVDFTPYTRCKAVLSLWAGVERLVGNVTLVQPLCRMVNSDLTDGMVEYVTGHVLRHHLGMDAHLHGQDGVWRNGTALPRARDRAVAVLGLGELGTTVAKALAALNFQVLGWSRTAKTVQGVTCYAGDDGLKAVLAAAEIVVLLLPRTADTENLINAARLRQMRRGAIIINPGRGALIDDDALLAALDVGQIAHATLDVFRTEPLPPTHPFWGHPGVTVTPHIAADTRVPSACGVIAENIRRGEAGVAFLYLVDRAQGY